MSTIWEEYMAWKSTSDPIPDRLRPAQLIDTAHNPQIRSVQTMAQSTADALEDLFANNLPASYTVDDIAALRAAVGIPTGLTTSLTRITDVNTPPV